MCSLGFDRKVLGGCDAEDRVEVGFPKEGVEGGRGGEVVLDHEGREDGQEFEDRGQGEESEGKP